MGPSNRYRSLPDGRRVFFANFPGAGCYVIPDPSTEQRLSRKTRAEFPLLLFSFVVLAGVLGWVYREVSGRYIVGILPLSLSLFTVFFRWLWYGKDLQGLKKIDYEGAISSFYEELRSNLRSHSKSSLPNYEISTSLDIPGSRDKVLMLQYSESFPNILRCRADGSIVWQAELPGREDVYTNLEWKDGRLHAFSRSCRSVVLDEASGKILPSIASVQQSHG